MKRLWRVFLFPKWPALLLLLAFTATALPAVFVYGLEESVPAYVIFSIAAYTATAAAVRAVQLFRRARARLYAHPLVNRYRTDLDFRAEVSLKLSFGVNIAYVLYKAAAGIWLRSAWFGAMAFYYLILSTQRFFLLHNLKSGKEPDAHRVRRIYRFCGFLLLILTTAVLAMGLHVVFGGQAVTYPGYVIYAAAGYTFYSGILAAVNLVRYRRHGNLLHTAGKNIALASALVSVFFLQTAMLASFGGDPAWRTQMNLGTGAAVFLLVTGMSCFMIRGGAAGRGEAVREETDNN